MGKHLSAKYDVDEVVSNNVDESSLLGINFDEEVKLDEQDSTSLNSTLTVPKTVIGIPTKAYVDSLSERGRTRRILSTVFNDQVIDFDKIEITNLDSLTVNSNPTLDAEVSKNNLLMMS